MKNQTILTTGATAGIGRHAAHALAARGHRARYVTPARNLLLVWLLKALPTAWGDAIFRRVAGL